MIDIKLIRENKELVCENIKKKFQNEKLPLVDEIYDMDKRFREVKVKADDLKALKNKSSDEIGNLMRMGKKDEALKIKEEIVSYSKEIEALEKEEEELTQTIKEKMMVIPNIIDDTVPIGPDDSYNQEIEKFGEPIVPDYEIPHHADIIEKLGCLDKE